MDTNKREEKRFARKGRHGAKGRTRKEIARGDAEARRGGKDFFDRMNRIYRMRKSGRG
jgi:hypothetical protein